MLSGLQESTFFLKLQQWSLWPNSSASPWLQNRSPNFQVAVGIMVPPCWVVLRTLKSVLIVAVTWQKSQYFVLRCHFFSQPPLRTFRLFQHAMLLNDWSEFHGSVCLCAGTAGLSSSDYSTSRSRLTYLEEQLSEAVKKNVLFDQNSEMLLLWSDASVMFFLFYYFISNNTENKMRRSSSSIIISSSSELVNLW